MYNTAFRVLEVLETRDEPVSGEQISGKLGISRSAVWKHVKELKGMGYEIEASQKEVYRLIKKSNRLLPHEVQKRLRTNFIGRKMRYFESTPSTNSVGRQLAGEGEAADLHGMVIVAEEQTGGTDRLGRSGSHPRAGSGGSRQRGCHWSTFRPPSSQTPPSEQYSGAACNHRRAQAC